MSRLWPTLLVILALGLTDCGDDSTPVPKGAAPELLVIDAPADLAVYPPDFLAPRVLWKDATEGVSAWRVDISTDAEKSIVRRIVPGTKPPLGLIDPACIAATNELPEEPGPFERSWLLPDDVWTDVRARTKETWATLTITGIDPKQPDVALSEGWARFKTSKDPVGSPIFYRDVPLAPGETERGRIKPLPDGAVPLIQWRLRDVSKPKSRLLLESMPTCANCHSFSKDGSTFGMDVDGPEGDKGTYALLDVKPQMVIRYEDIFTWNAFEDKPKDHHTLGFLSRVSPDGRHVVSTVNEELYVANFTTFQFLQVFYPTRGVLAIHDRDRDTLEALPGADDTQYVHCNGAWDPDGRSIVFSRAPAKDAYVPGVPLATFAGDPNETQIQYDLYRVPFNDGKGGTPVPIEGASANGMSNTFPKVSPDGKWIVYVKCENGQLMRPDGRLWIVPAEGGEAHEMQCNTWRMNSWHSFSPNSRWLVFSSKSNTPYTQMFLTHIDEDGSDSPAILIPNSTAANRAVNLPEFMNAGYDALQSIEVPGVEHRRQIVQGAMLLDAGRVEAAVGRFQEAANTNPESADAWLNLGWALSVVGRKQEAIAALEKSVALEPGQATAQNTLGYELMRNTEDPAALGRASHHLRKAHVLDPAMTKALGNLALVLFQLGEFGDAEKAYRELVRRHPKSPEALGALSTLCLRRGAVAEGAAYLGRAVEVSPNEIGLLNSLAWLLATAPAPAVRDGGRAAELAERLVEAAPDRSASHLDTLAAAYAEAGRFEEARKIAEEAAGKAQGELLESIRKRQALYNQDRPYRQTR